MNGIHSKKEGRAQSPCATLDGCGAGYLAYYGKKKSDDVPSYKIVGIAGSGETTLRKGRGYWVYAQNDTNMTLKEVLPSDSSPTYSYPIRRIYFRNDTSGEIRNITAAVEPQNPAEWVGKTYYGWFGSCNPYIGLGNIIRANCSLSPLSNIYWWDPIKVQFQTYSYLDNLNINNYKGLFIKFNYENISMILLE